MARKTKSWIQLELAIGRIQLELDRVKSDLSPNRGMEAGAANDINGGLRKVVTACLFALMQSSVLYERLNRPTKRKS